MYSDRNHTFLSKCHVLIHQQFHRRQSNNHFGHTSLTITFLLIQLSTTDMCEEFPLQYRSHIIWSLQIVQSHIFHNQLRPRTLATLSVDRSIDQLEFYCQHTILLNLVLRSFFLKSAWKDWKRFTALVWAVETCSLSLIEIYRDQDTERTTAALNLIQLLSDKIPKN